MAGFAKIFVVAFFVTETLALAITPDGLLDWRMIQSMVRLMPDLHKTLLLASLHPQQDNDGNWQVQELAMASEHAPFRHKHLERRQNAARVGNQRKKKRQKQEQDGTVASQEKTVDNNNDDKAFT